MTSPATAAVAPTGTATPSVLAVIVVGAGDGPWLRDCLLSLAHQSYPRMGVLAVDDGADAESRELLDRSLGGRRVLRNERRVGLAESVRAALGRPVASGADFVLLVSPRASLDREAVGRLVEAAVGIGVEDVGIVGAKVVDRDQPRALIDIGRSSDRFGHPYSPLQAGEIDQGQFDRVLEVLCVSSAAMLLARDARERAGVFDERLDPAHADLDLCWRVRVAGFRILMTPLARVRLAASDDAERVDAPHRRSPRYEEDRAAITSMLKNYSFVSLLWIVPAAIALGLVRFVFLVFARRFEEAFDVAGAWAWNVAHLPGTLARRRRIQKARGVRDRALRRFMESAGLRLPRWFATAERILEEQRAIDEADEGEPIRRRLRDRTASLVGTHPVIIGSFLAIVVGAAATRELIGLDRLGGGALPAIPDRVADLFAELASPARSTPLGGPLSPSPALGALGLLSSLLLGNTQLAAKAVLLGAVPLAAILSYRAAVRRSVRPGPAVLAAAAYVLGALTLWAFSEGRIGLLLALAVLPAASERIEAAFSAAGPVGDRRRFVAGAGVTMAVGIAGFPGIVLAMVLLVLVHVVAAPARARGLGLVAAATVVAAVLLFPFLPTVLADGGRALSSLVGTTEPDRLLRLALGPGPGTWVIALFVPVAAVLGLGLARGELRGPAIRAALVGSSALVLAWLSAADFLPVPLSNPAAYGAAAAVSMVSLVGFGLTSFTGSLRLEAFGLRQVAGALLVVVLGVGLFLQSVAAMVGTWGVGDPADRIPPAWAVVSGATHGPFRVLWLAGDGTEALPPPGGDPQRRLEAGPATIRYALTDRSGSSVLDVGRPLAGPGPERLDAALRELLGPTTRHGGALLAPFGIRYIVAARGALPPAAASALDAQLDVNLEPASGFVIYRNAAAIPPAAVLATEASDRPTIETGDLATIARWRPVPATRLSRVPGGWDGPPAAGTVFLATEYDAGLRLAVGDAEPFVAFGWATAFDTGGDAPTRVRHAGRLPGRIQVVVLALLWLAALWATRKPVPR